VDATTTPTAHNGEMGHAAAVAVGGSTVEKEGAAELPARGNEP